VKAATNSSATVSSTMNRLASTQDWPALRYRALTAVAAAAAMSASARTMNGSEPPSSRTCFFSTAAAWAATIAPTSVEPVRVTAATRGSAMIPATWSTSMRRVRHSPSGAPALRTASSTARAHCGTLFACLSRVPLPAARAGAAKRKNCQKG
jgi:hypothetical protein